MAELTARLRERAEFEDKRVLDEATALGFVPEVYSGSQTGALLLEAAAALEAAREDAERYRWLRERASKLGVYSDVPADVLINGDWCDQPGQLDAAIDQARGKAGQEVGK